MLLINSIASPDTEDGMKASRGISGRHEQELLPVIGSYEKVQDLSPFCDFGKDTSPLYIFLPSTKSKMTGLVAWLIGSGLPPRLAICVAIPGRIRWKKSADMNKMFCVFFHFK